MRRVKKPAVIRPADYLILNALARRPMNNKEIMRATHLSEDAIRKRTIELESQNIIHRCHNRQWVVNIVLWVAPVTDIASVTSGEKVILKTPEIEGEEPLPERKIPRPPKVEADGEQKPEEYRPPKTIRKVSKEAERLGNRMNIPTYLEGYGELSMGKLGKCTLCAQKNENKPTPFRYGGESVCPLCARGGA